MFICILLLHWIPHDKWFKGNGLFVCALIQIYTQKVYPKALI